MFITSALTTWHAWLSLALWTWKVSEGLSCPERILLVLKQFVFKLFVLLAGIWRVAEQTLRSSLVYCELSCVKHRGERDKLFMLRKSVLWHKQDVAESNFLCVLVQLLAWLQASAAKHLRTALFCVITHRVVIISYRRFGTTYRSHPQGVKIKK